MVLAAEPVCICGVDVAAPQQVRRSKQEPLESFFSSFERQFTSDEASMMYPRSVAPPNSAAQAQSPEVLVDRQSQR